MITTKTTIHVTIRMGSAMFFFYDSNSPFQYAYSNAIRYCEKAESYTSPGGDVEIHVVYSSDNIKHAVRCEEQLKEMVKTYEHLYHQRNGVLYESPES